MPKYTSMLPACATQNLNIIKIDFFFLLGKDRQPLLVYQNLNHSGMGTYIKRCILQIFFYILTSLYKWSLVLCALKLALKVSYLNSSTCCIPNGSQHLIIILLLEKCRTLWILFFESVSKTFLMWLLNYSMEICQLFNFLLPL